MNEVDREILESLPKPKRKMAPFKWVGGKGNMAKFIIKHLPVDDVKTYVEPFAGAASVFWHLDNPFPIEVLNDLDERIINLFRVLQNDVKFAKLVHKLIWTPYSKSEWDKALSILSGPMVNEVDYAWAFFVSQNQGFGGRSTSWGRSFTVKAGQSDVTNSWRKRLAVLVDFNRRLSRVQLENHDALYILDYWDSETTLFYLDPPYVPTTRGNEYKHETSFDFHVELINKLKEKIRGKVVLSGYPNDVYTTLEDAGWKTVTRETAAYSSARKRGRKVVGSGNAKKYAKRTEVLWVKDWVG